MKLNSHIFASTGSALMKGVVLSASVCVAGYFVGRACMNRALKTTAPRPLTAPHAPIVQAPPVTIEKHSSLLASSSETLPFVSAAQTPTPKKARASYKKVAAKKAVAVKARKKIEEPASEYDSEEPLWVDAGLLAEEQAPSEDADQAEDIYDATAVALLTPVDESEVADADDLKAPTTLAWQFDQGMSVDKEVAAERVYGEIAGTYKKNDFSEIRAQLTTLTQNGESLGAPENTIEAAPESKLMAMEKAEAEVARKSQAPVAAAEGEVLSGTIVSKVTLPTAPANATPAPQVFVDPSIKEEALKPVQVKPVAEPIAPPAKEEIVEEKPAPAPEHRAEAKENALAPVLATAAGASDSVGPTLVTATGGAVASATSILKTASKSLGEPTLVAPTHAMATQPVAPPKTTQPAGPPTLVTPSAPPTTVVQNTRNPNRRAEIFGPASAPDERIIDEKLFGEVLVDGQLSQWLVENKAHIELNLHPVTSRDPQDTVYIDYQYPAADFSLDTREMRGAYRLLADIYTSNAKAPYAQVLYKKAISADTAKEKVLFHVSMREVEQSKLGSPQRHRQIALSSTIFEGASGDYRDPKAVAKGSVDVIGFPELGHIQAEADGTFRLPYVPSQSELLLHVQADGFYPSFKVVPTFATDVYAPVYLLAKDKVDVITRYFTHHLQGGDNGLVMGRVFDSKTRTPVADERLSLTFRRGAPVYFSALGALPIVPSVTSALDSLATTVNGMFAFFNLKPSMRSLSRASGKASLLVNVHPQSADYVEFGRGGVRSLRGQILDRRNPVPARVRLVGDRHVEVDTDPQGNFTIPDLDLPPGVVTLEVEAHGYPTTWHSVSWNPREPEGSHRLYVFDKDVVYHDVAGNARVQVDSRQGVLIGQNSIFPKHAPCVYVALFDSNGKAVDDAQGPFSVSEAPKEGVPGLCLTRQKPWFSYFNLPAGEYVLKLTDQNSRTVRSHVVRVGADRVAISAD